MLPKYEAIGYQFEKITDLVDLLKSNPTKAAYYDSMDGSTECALILPDRATRFWYYRSKEESFISGVDLHYKGNTSFWVRNVNWVCGQSEPKYRDSNGKLAPINSQARPLVATGGKGTTICVNMVEAPLMGALGANCRIRLAATAFCEEARVFPGETEDTFVPLGMFTADGEPETPRATMTAGIKKVTKRTNSVTGIEFYEIDIETLGMEFTVVSSLEALVGEPKKGMRMTGNFWISATVKEIMYQ